LRSVLRTKPQLRCCLKRCRHCRIFFLTHPRNAGRTDLGCPFGCREAHRRQRSTQRSVAYYREENGKQKKALQNRKRYQVSCEDTQPASEEARPAEKEQIAAPIVEHVRMVTSLIEGREVRLDEIAEMRQRISRQHSIWRRRRIDYVVRELNKDPP